jgi:hypothetical protein
VFVLVGIDCIRMYDNRKGQVNENEGMLDEEIDYVNLKEKINCAVIIS